MSIDTAIPIHVALPKQFERELTRRPDRPNATGEPASSHHSIGRIVDAAPPLTDGRRERLAVILGGGRR